MALPKPLVSAWHSVARFGRGALSLQRKNQAELSGSSTSNSLQSLNTLPQDIVLKLAHAGNALAARHIRRSRTLWLRRATGMLSCDECHRSWLRFEKPAHADFCPVGRVQSGANEILQLNAVPLPTHLRPRLKVLSDGTAVRRPMQAAAPVAPEGFLVVKREGHKWTPTTWTNRYVFRAEESLHEVPARVSLDEALSALQFARAEFPASEFRLDPVPVEMLRLEEFRSPEPEQFEPLRITEVPSTHPTERSGANGRTERRRSGDSVGSLTRAAAAQDAGAVLAMAPERDCGEPWAWNPRLCVVVDRRGHTVANMVMTDLSVLEQEVVGRRIVACVNFLKGTPNEWLHDAKRKSAEAMHGPGTIEPEEFEGIRLDLDVNGWFVAENGARITFPDYLGAKAYFTSRKAALTPAVQA